MNAPAEATAVKVRAAATAATCAERCRIPSSVVMEHGFISNSPVVCEPARPGRREQSGLPHHPERVANCDESTICHQRAGRGRWIDVAQLAWMMNVRVWSPAGVIEVTRMVWRPGESARSRRPSP
jgi:hypothetical protein